MKYETPELSALTPAINAIQSTSGVSKTGSQQDAQHPSQSNDATGAYADWE